MIRQVDRSLQPDAPRVSVIIPAYNAAGYLERALDSALAQTMSDLEVIVVDDASVDATSDKACRSAVRDPRVRLLKNDRNRGVSASRNRGIGASWGEWIALLDADDVWLPERLERMLAEATNADVVSDDVSIIHETTRGFSGSAAKSLIQQQNLSVKGSAWIDLLGFVVHDLGLLKPIFRRAFFDRYQLSYRTDVRYAEDYLLYFEVLALEARWKQLPQAYYLHYKHVGSVSTTSLRDQRKKLALWQGVLENTQTLLSHPAAANDAAIMAALSRHHQEALGHITFASFWEALRERRFVELAGQLFKRPSNLTLLAKYSTKRLSIRLIWRIRRWRG